MFGNSQQFGTGGYHFVDSFNGHNGNHIGQRVNKGFKKSERSMLTKTMLWLFYFCGIPALITGWFSILNWINWHSPLEVVTAFVSLVVGVSKGIIMWAEKGHIVRRWWNNIFWKRHKRKKKKATQDVTDIF